MSYESVTIKITMPIKTLMSAISAAHSRGESVPMFMESAVFAASVAEIGRPTHGDIGEIEDISYEDLKVLVAFVRLEQK